MEIILTTDEYEALLEMVQIASWILHAYRVEHEPETKAYRDLEQKILSLAKEAGFGDLVQYSEELREYFPSRAFEEEGRAMQFIEEYDEESFWDELAERLSTRDLVEEEGEVKVERMDRWERATRIESGHGKYLEEFERHGLGRLRLQT
jgi:hypothetical protein